MGEEKDSGITLFGKKIPIPLRVAVFPGDESAVGESGRVNFPDESNSGSERDRCFDDDNREDTYEEIKHEDEMVKFNMLITLQIAIIEQFLQKDFSFSLN